MLILVDPDHTLKSQKVEFLLENNRSKIYSWIRIRICIPYTDPNPGRLNQCGSGSTTLIKMSKYQNTDEKPAGKAI
jgi:hypothetical protein